MKKSIQYKIDKNNLTFKKFKEYEKEICKRMSFSKNVWVEYRTDIICYFGYYDPNIKYAGRGDSSKPNLSEKLIPEPYDNFIYYVHDGFYELIKKRKDYHLFKDRADNIMEEMMNIKAKCKLLPKLYRFFVGIFG